MSKLVAVLFIFATPLAHANTIGEVVDTYASKAFAQYSEAVFTAEQLEAAIEQFVADPTEANLVLMRTAWLSARTAYSPTEVYRFYGGPIDSEIEGQEGPEGALNAWPLDEAYIDYVEGDANAGFIQNPSLYPSLDAIVLSDLNEKQGEKSIATGYHAIEFMLWGQDFYNDSPGRRPVTDYTTAPFAERRKQYLSAAVQVLVRDLTSVREAWAPDVADNFRAKFTMEARQTESLTNILTGVVQLAGFELSQERMFTALDNRDQEDEHSCFSDNTHNDFIDNFRGIKTVLQDGLIELVRVQNESVAEELIDALALAEKEILALPAPFDQAIIDEAKRPQVMKGVAALETLAEATKQAALELGITLPQE